MTATAKLSRVAPGLDPEVVAAWCRSVGRPPPAEMGQRQLQLLLVWLSHAENRERVAAWAATRT